jgi:superfamily I DNA/RNA helicase
LSSLPSVVSDISNAKASNIFLDSNFHISDPREQTRILKETLEEYNISMTRYPNVKLDMIIKTISSCKAMLYMGENPFVPPKKNEIQTDQMKITTTIYYRFREKFLSTNSLDFDDLIFLTRELLLNYEDVRYRLQRRWQHIFVDEYQDTSTVQVELIKLLTTNSLFVVGDADQSIYAWRGAYAESLYDFEHVFKDFSPDGVATVYLMENYRYVRERCVHNFINIDPFFNRSDVTFAPVTLLRSTSKIVKAAQKVISQSTAKSGADKLRREMIPRGSDGTAPRILSFHNGESEGMSLLFFARSCCL